VTNFDSIPRDGIMTITPDIAAEWLEHRNKGNRRISAHIVKQYAQAMREGRWMITHQGIAFDATGNLADGQHRLNASVESGVTFQAMVTVGVPRETFSVLDTGWKRQANQLIDHPNRTIIAAAARIVGYIDGLIPKDVPIQGHVAPNKVDNDLIIHIYQQWPELSSWAAPAQMAPRSTGIIPSAHLAAIAQAARSPYEHLIESWFEGVNTGAGLEAGDPRLTLRNRFIQGADIRGHGTARMARSYQLIAKAWNYYAQGQSISHLKVLADQKPPAIIGARVGTGR